MCFPLEYGVSTRLSTQKEAHTKILPNFKPNFVVLTLSEDLAHVYKHHKFIHRSLLKLLHILHLHGCRIQFLGLPSPTGLRRV